MRTVPIKLNYRQAPFMFFGLIVFLISAGSIERNVTILLHPEKVRHGDGVSAYNSFLDLIPYQITFVFVGYFILFLIGSIFFSLYKIYRVRENSKQLIELSIILSCSAVLNGIYIYLFKPAYICPGDYCYGVSSAAALAFFWIGLVSFLIISFYKKIKFLTEKQ